MKRRPVITESAITQIIKVYRQLINLSGSTPKIHQDAKTKTYIFEIPTDPIYHRRFFILAVKTSDRYWNNPPSLVLKYIDEVAKKIEKIYGHALRFCDGIVIAFIGNVTRGCFKLAGRSFASMWFTAIIDTKITKTLKRLSEIAKHIKSLVATRLLRLLQSYFRSRAHRIADSARDKVGKVYGSVKTITDLFTMYTELLSVWIDSLGG